MAVALIGPQAGEPPYAPGVAVKRQKKKRHKKSLKKVVCIHYLQASHSKIHNLEVSCNSGPFDNCANSSAV